MHGFVCLILFGCWESGKEYKARMSKEDFRQRRYKSEKTRDHWAMESGKGLLAIQYAGFQLG